MTEYFVKNWDGWPLHSLIAAAFMWAGYHWPLETLLVANTIWWPDREATQHYTKGYKGKWGRLEGYANIWTFHRIMEWGCPVAVGFILYAVLNGGVQ